MEDFESEFEKALRERLLEEIRGGRQSQIVNNLYGASGGASAPSSIREAMNPADYNYFVDITREDVLDPEGNKAGWKKRVKRYADPKEQMFAEILGQ